MLIKLNDTVLHILLQLALRINTEKQNLIHFQDILGIIKNHFPVIVSLNEFDLCRPQLALAISFVAFA